MPIVERAPLKSGFGRSSLLRREIRPLNIVHYVPNFRFADGGVVRAVFNWCNVFSRRGHRMTVMTYDGPDIPERWLDGASDETSALMLPPATMRGTRLNRRALDLAEEKIKRADIVHLHAPWLAGNRQIASIARRHRVPYVVTTHGMLDKWSMSQRSLKKKIYMKLFGSAFLNRAACVHCTVRAELTQASKWFNNPRTAVMPYMMDLEPFENMPSPEVGLSLLPRHRRYEPVILFLGRLHEKKGVDILIRAAAMLRDQNHSFVVAIAGTGEAAYERYLRALLSELRLEDRVYFLGMVSGVQKYSLLHAADVSVLATHQENFGLSLTESMAAGTAVITTKGTDIWREIQQAGAVIAEATPEAIAREAGTLLDAPHKLAHLGKRGREWAFEHFAIDRLAQRYESMYYRLADASKDEARVPAMA